MAAKKKTTKTEENASSWDIGTGGGDGPRPYAMQIVTAQFEIASDRNGKIVEFGDTNLWSLVFEGPTFFLDDEYEIDEEAETPDNRDYPARSFTMGTVKEMNDENEDGRSITMLKGKGPRNYFDGGQALRSLIMLVGDGDAEAGMQWLDENFGPWNQAESWEGRVMTVHTRFEVDDEGNVLKTKGGRDKTLTEIVGFGDIGVGTHVF